MRKSFNILQPLGVFMKNFDSAADIFCINRLDWTLFFLPECRMNYSDGFNLLFHNTDGVLKPLLRLDSPTVLVHGYNYLFTDTAQFDDEEEIIRSFRILNFKKGTGHVFLIHISQILVADITAHS